MTPLTERLANSLECDVCGKPATITVYEKGLKTYICEEHDQPVSTEELSDYEYDQKHGQPNC